MPCYSWLVASLLHLRKGDDFLIPDPDMLAASITHGPLLGRKWVLQELLQASRNI